MNIDVLELEKINSLLNGLVAGKLEVIELHILKSKVENLLNLYKLLELHYNDLLDILKGDDKE